MCFTTFDKLFIYLFENPRPRIYYFVSAHKIAMLPEEYEKTYGPEFSYEHRWVVAKPIDYDMSDYHFSITLGLGMH